MMLQRRLSPYPSQPARMRCGKGQQTRAYQLQKRRNPRECAVAKSHCDEPFARKPCRNPRECAVAKNSAEFWAYMDEVATRANALWQRLIAPLTVSSPPVATRANALWQSDTKIDRLGVLSVATRANALWQRRGQRPVTACICVATRANALWQSVSCCRGALVPASQPARMRCGKGWSRNCQTCNA